ncbi:MAG: glycosyltransferase family 2 protein [Thermoplasmatota archaeon]
MPPASSAPPGAEDPDVGPKATAPSHSPGPAGERTPLLVVGRAKSPQRPPHTRLTILLPARDEESGLGRTLAALPLHTLAARGYDVDVLVVDGDSQDNTARVARAWGARVGAHPGGGKGNDVRGAFERLDSDFVVMLDSDHTYPEHDIPRFVQALEGGADVVMGNRFGGAIEDSAMSRVNRFGNRALSLLASTLYLHRTHDVCTGMWAFRTESLQMLSLRAKGFELEAEIFAQAARAGLTIAEIPISYRARVGETKLTPVAAGFSIGRALLANVFRGRRVRSAGNGTTPTLRAHRPVVGLARVQRATDARGRKANGPA